MHVTTDYSVDSAVTIRGAVYTPSLTSVYVLLNVSHAKHCRRFRCFSSTG